MLCALQDEAEAELSALEKVEIDFALPESEFGELMKAKLSGKELRIKVENEESDQNENERIEMLTEIKIENDDIEGDFKETTDSSKKAGAERGYKKEIVKRGAKKKDLTLIKDSPSLKKDSPNKNEISKELKKGTTKEEEKKEPVKKSVQDVKKDINKDEKKEITTKGNKRDSSLKSHTEQIKKELEQKKPDQKKTLNQRGGTTQPRSETPKQPTLEIKRVEAKILRSENPKPLRKDTNNEKKRETPDKAEGKSPESVRGSKLRTREKKTADPEIISGQYNSLNFLIFL